MGTPEIHLQATDDFAGMSVFRHGVVVSSRVEKEPPEARRYHFFSRVCTLLNRPHDTADGHWPV